MPRCLFRMGIRSLLQQKKKNKANHPVKTYSFRCKKSIHALFGKYTIPQSSTLHVQDTVYTTHFENKFLASSEYYPKPPQPPPKPLKGAGTENFGPIYLDNLGTI